MTTTNRREKFTSLAEKRVTNAIKYIRLIGNLSNKGNYSYTEEDIEKIFKALNREVKSTKERFLLESNSSEAIFKL